MSLSENRRNKIKEYILEKIANNEDVVKKTCACYGVSETTVYRYLQELREEGAIERKQRGKYILVEKELDFVYRNIGLEEDTIYTRDIEPILLQQNLPENVMKIWCYVFTEMLNNAIEHSETDKIFCSMYVSKARVQMIIRDDGIGIFKKIKEYYNYASLDDAIGELFKGKLTTDSANHTGEGIFFSSRVMDGFVVVSSGKYFTHDDCYENIVTLEEDDLLNKFLKDKGTVVLMELANRSRKELREVFDMFSDEEEGFNKTSIPMKNIFGNSFPVSRSQARRLTNRLDKFTEVELDFSGVSEIGQAFAHELFVKFERLKPDVKIKVINANEEVQGMINRVKKTK